MENRSVQRMSDAYEAIKSPHKNDAVPQSGTNPFSGAHRFGMGTSYDIEFELTSFYQPIIIKHSFKSLTSLLGDIVEKWRLFDAYLLYAFIEVLLAMCELDVKPPTSFIEQWKFETINDSSGIAEQQAQSVKITCDKRFSDEKIHNFFEAKGQASSNERFIQEIEMMDLRIGLNHSATIEISDGSRKFIGEMPRDDRAFMDFGEGRKNRQWLKNLKKEIHRRRSSRRSSKSIKVTKRIPRETSKEIPPEASKQDPKYISSESSVAASLGPTYPLQVTQVNEVFDQTSSVIGPAGGEVRVGGCELRIPEGALDSKVTITLQSVYRRNEEMGLLTWVFKCEPHGLRFLATTTVRLYTCYLFDKPVKVEARRSEDGKHWENIKQFYHTDGRYFEFDVKGFSWFATFLTDVEMWWRSKLRKSLICFIHPYPPTSSIAILKCWIDDDISGVKRNVLSHEIILEMNFLMKKHEENVNIDLSIVDENHPGDVTIDPRSRHLDVSQRSRDETSFKLRWQQTTDDPCELSASVTTTIDEVDRTTYIRPPATGVTDQNESQLEESTRQGGASTANTSQASSAPKYEIQISSVENLSLGDGAAVQMSTPSADDVSKQSNIKQATDAENTNLPTASSSSMNRNQETTGETSARSSSTDGPKVPPGYQ